MNLREAKNYLKRGDLQMIAKNYGYSHTTISTVMQMKFRNKAVETAIIEIAKIRKQESEENLEKVLGNLK